MDPLTNDLRFALGMIRNGPDFTTVAIPTLTLGANTAIFRLVNAVLLKRCHFRTPTIQVDPMVVLRFE